MTFSDLQPESSEAFALGGYARGGWSFLYRRCRATAELNGPNGLEDNFLFLNHDVLVVQIDADVARSNDRAGHIEDPTDDQWPCVTRHCVEALRFEQDLLSTTRGPSTPPSPISPL